jgi:starvation-inducible outer membrane lipoprotein
VSDLTEEQTMPKIFLLSLFALLSGCVAYPAYYPAPAPTPTHDPVRAQAIANEQCAKSGKVAVKVKPTNCTSQNCTTAYECQ